MNQCRTARQTGRALHERQVVEQDVFQVGKLPARAVIVEEPLLLRGHKREAAVALYRRFGGTTDHIDTAITGDVVPQHLDAILGHRERHTAIGIGKTGAAIEQLGRGRVFQGVVIQPLRRRARAARGIDRHLEGVGVAVEQCDLTRAEVGLVLFKVGLGDGEQGLVRRIRVQVMLARLVARRCLGDAAVPGRNGPGRIAGTLGPQRRQRGLQLLG
ncbi:hypothetical protein D3C71_1057250 [compost metagenome]